MMNAEPQPEHAWLQQLVGEWVTEMDACESEKTGEKVRGTETVRSLGSLWIVGDGTGQMPDGSPANTQVTLGYDPAQQRFVGTWVGSMMTHMWVYSGSLDESRKVLTLEAEGPDFSDPSKTGKYRDVVELHSRDHRTLTSYALAEDGSWNQFMTMHLYRKGS